ncbi:MAG: AlkA N-terminal domain-containing protein, partial [Solirubrobacterales bacterium]
MNLVIEDFERCYRFMGSRDPRYDGFFVVGVLSTGIYCRPSCPARLPMRKNVRLFATVAAAQAAGLRACKRCDPDAAPGSPAWNRRADIAGRAVRMIADGVVDRDGVGGLATRLHFSERQLHRVLVAELGAGPVALARAQRAQTARTLIESTGLRFIEVATAAGFGSVRQFNDTIRAVYGRTPRELRDRVRRRGATPSPGSIELRLPYRGLLAGDALLSFFASRAIAGVEGVDGRAYRRTLALEHGNGIVELTPGDGAIGCSLKLEDLRDLTAAVARCRHLLDLDADPNAIAERLGGDPVIGALVRRVPGLRVPRCIDGFEILVRAILTQQVSVRGARTAIGRLVERYGKPLSTVDGGLTHLFPTPEAIANADPSDLRMPGTRAAALKTAARMVAEGEITLNAGSDARDSAAALTAIKGIGPWTASYVAMRALGDPDAFLASDLGVRRGLASLGHDVSPVEATALAESWRPWRSYATI